MQQKLHLPSTAIGQLQESPMSLSRSLHLQLDGIYNFQRKSIINQLNINIVGRNIIFVVVINDVFITFGDHHAYACLLIATSLRKQLLRFKELLTEITLCS